MDIGERWDGKENGMGYFFQIRQRPLLQPLIPNKLIPAIARAHRNTFIQLLLLLERQREERRGARKHLFLQGFWDPVADQLEEAGGGAGGADLLDGLEGRGGGGVVEVGGYVDGGDVEGGDGDGHFCGVKLGRGREVEGVAVDFSVSEDGKGLTTQFFSNRLL